MKGVVVLCIGEMCGDHYVFFAFFIPVLEVNMVDVLSSKSKIKTTFLFHRRQQRAIFQYIY